jgi:hypothetical protein
MVSYCKLAIILHSCICALYCLRICSVVEFMFCNHQMSVLCIALNMESIREA